MRILIFGPNGSGKGTQSSKLLKKFSLAHVESGGIFRLNIQGGTKLGQEAKAYIDRGELVPDEITIPMIIDRLSQADCQSGWILDGFPRNPAQSTALIEGLDQAGSPLDAVVIIECRRKTATDRLLGRRTCPQGHPNNTAIPAICPLEKDGALCCWNCGTEVTVRPDDVDLKAIDQRLDIYFDETNGTLASIKVVKDWASSKPRVKVISLNGEGEIEAISAELMAALEG